MNAAPQLKQALESRRHRGSFHAQMILNSEPDQNCSHHEQWNKVHHVTHGYGWHGQTDRSHLREAGSKQYQNRTKKRRTILQDELFSSQQHKTDTHRENERSNFDQSNRWFLSIRSVERRPGRMNEREVGVKSYGREQIEIDAFAQVIQSECTQRAGIDDAQLVVKAEFGPGMKTEKIVQPKEESDREIRQPKCDLRLHFLAQRCAGVAPRPERCQHQYPAMENEIGPGADG